MTAERSCVNCGSYHCDRMEGKYPEFCVTTNTDEQLFHDALGHYTDDSDEAKMFKAAAEIEGLYYGRLTRVEETIVFAKKIGAKRIGVATCRGLINEARQFCKILRAKGFEDVFAVACKAGGLDKTEAGIPEGVKVRPGGHESICNPVAQADILNQRECDLNVIIGLCVGHDTLFIKHSEAPVTCLIVKDRVTGHNPAAPLYLTDTYYARLLSPDMPEEKPC